MENLLKIFKALSDKNRVRILQMLTKKTLCVCEIQEILNVTTSTVSKHLSILKEAGFIIDKKDGKWVNYSLNLSSNDIAVNQMLLLLPIYLHNDELINDDKTKSMSICRTDICCN